MTSSSNYLRRRTQPSVRPLSRRSPRLSRRTTQSSESPTLSDEVDRKCAVSRRSDRTLHWAGSEPVKEFETIRQPFFCASFPIVGLLIHATVGSFGGDGRR